MSCGDFVGTLLHAGTQAHILHLGTRSFAEHKALEEFYEGIVEAVDEFAEAYQGAYDLIDGWPESFEGVDGDALTFLQTLSKSVDDGRKDLPQDSEIQNLVDEVQALIDQTIYKLRFLA